MIPWLADNPTLFPDTNTALDEPNGLLAAGGDLSPARLISAYRQGIFPWYSEDDPILWWSPAPRCVLTPQSVHLSRSLRKTLKKHAFTVTFDRAFTQVVAHCASSGDRAEGTWICEDMCHAYQQLHTLGHAHSVEVWSGEDLVGGLYGVAINKVFFGESMFSTRSNSSKIALCYLAAQLAAWEFDLIDCQVHNPHLESLGAVEIDRTEFEHFLAKNADYPATKTAQWSLELDNTQVCAFFSPPGNTL
ncbi:MAG: leucyl/phenylalanyl-tRNA--protein transferase [Pseudomonadales bacterium]